MISPLPGATNVPLTGAKFKFDFNEYITIKTAQNIFLSPPGKKMPKSKIQGKSLIVTIDDTLKANTTYTINFTDALADNNEGNPYPGYTYVFTTGDHIDSLGITGVVQDCNDLSPVKGATVLLYKNLADSAVFLERPYAAAKTDDWGFFIIPFIEDTLYRLYAIKDEGNNNIYDPDADLIAFEDSLVRPVMVISDTLREFMKYDMTDTLGCRARRTEYELNLFRESTSKQYIKNKVRVSDRAAYITFASADAWIDSLWITGYQPDRIITQFNMKQDSLEIWINDRGPVPDTLNLYVNYRKTDTLGNKVPTLERVKLFQEGKKKAKTAYEAQKNIQHTDTICNFTASARPETVEQKGFELEFTLPVISEMFDSVKLFSVNPRQQESVEKFKVVRDSTNIRKYAILPQLNYLPGYEYILKIPQNCFHDINGYGNDSLEVKVSLPVDDALSSLNLVLKDVGSKYIVDLLDEGMKEPLRTYIITSDCTLSFPYLKEGKYAIRISDDGNDNSIVDTGNLLEHKQPEKVLFYTLKNEKLINIPASAELTQTINIKQLFNK